MDEHVEDRIKKLEEAEKDLVRRYFASKTRGVVVEVGANEPVSIFSQSFHLEEKLSWKAILIEPNPALAQKAQRLRPGAHVHECACCERERMLELHIPVSADGEISGHAAIEKNIDDHHYDTFRTIPVRGRRLDAVLDEAGVREIDVLSIDVEGAELQVLRGIDLERFRPRLILLEDKHVFLNKHRYLKARGYRLVKRTGMNCWYVPRGSPRPPQSLGEKLRLLKRMYLSIWLKKLKLHLRQK